jgi:predicted transcriptional regulator of viral defense system
MKYIKKTVRRPKTAPAQALARAAVMRLIGEGRCVFSAEEIHGITGISAASARTFLVAGMKIGLFNALDKVIPIAHAGYYVATVRLPGTPSADVIALRALMHVAAGPANTTQAAFAYHTALELHGLTEVASPGIHVVKIRNSVHPPKLSRDMPYQPKARRLAEWTRVEDRPVWLTLRSPDQLPSQDVVTIQRELMPLPVTSVLRTLVDAWMHSDWCGGEDRVADSWRMYWEQNKKPDSPADLASLLVSSTWPGLWNSLVPWAETVTPSLAGLGKLIEKMAPKGAI